MGSVCIDNSMNCVVNDLVESMMNTGVALEKFNFCLLSIRDASYTKWFTKGEDFYCDIDEEDVFEKVEGVHTVVILDKFTIVLKECEELVLYNNCGEISDINQKMRIYNQMKGKVYDVINSIHCPAPNCWNVISRFEEDNLNASVVNGEIKCKDCGHIVEHTHENFYLFNGLKFNDYIGDAFYPSDEEFDEYVNKYHKGEC